MLLTFLPYFVFIMYAINRGTGFTQALFMNCDHSLLTYSFYKRPAFVLRLFSIRLREIIKVNLLPAAVIGGGLALLLLVTGGQRAAVRLRGAGGIDSVYEHIFLYSLLNHLLSASAL